MIDTLSTLRGRVILCVSADCRCIRYIEHCAQLWTHQRELLCVDAMSSIAALVVAYGSATEFQNLNGCKQASSMTIYQVDELSFLLYSLLDVRFQLRDLCVCIPDALSQRRICSSTITHKFVILVKNKLKH